MNYEHDEQHSGSMFKKAVPHGTEAGTACDQPQHYSRQRPHPLSSDIRRAHLEPPDNEHLPATPSIAAGKGMYVSRRKLSSYKQPLAPSRRASATHSTGDRNAARLLPLLHATTHCGKLHPNPTLTLCAPHLRRAKEETVQGTPAPEDVCRAAPCAGRSQAEDLWCKGINHRSSTMLGTDMG